MESSPRSVRPTLPIAPYVGGKRNLAGHVVKRIAGIPHQLYAEPFVGMGGVFLRRRVAAPIEVINDASRDVVTLFRILQRHHQAFLDMLRWQLASRDQFERLLAVDADTCTDLERAARFLYLQRMTFGGKVVGRTFGASRSNPSRFDMTKLGPMLEDVHERLAPVVIECLPYGRFIEQYDRRGALFYLDPPYHGTEHYYGRGLFSAEDCAKLAEQLAGLKGEFLLSINDTREIRRIFAGFAIERVSTTWQAGGMHVARRAAELVISGRRSRARGRRRAA